MAPVELGSRGDVQGDIWSKGFPKYHEAYYFFMIKDAALFRTALAKLATDPSDQILTAGNKEKRLPLISTLDKVLADQAYISANGAGGGWKPEKDRIPVSNALIAFTITGLANINSSTSDLSIIKQTDKVFSVGMARDTLHDPAATSWEDPFTQSTDDQAPKIHGMLKVGGSTREVVNKLLDAIQNVLQRGTVISDIPGAVTSRVDGWVREGKSKGKEHFDFQDGISQPLMPGIDKLSTEQTEKLKKGAWTMATNPSLILVGPNTHSGTGSSPLRPSWMNNGSFLVFRKLEQDVAKFNEFTMSNFLTAGCKTEEEFGAKLMGRDKAGVPLAKDKTKDDNEFQYPENDVQCPFTAHIRKTNPRVIVDGNNGDTRNNRARIVRNGIPYGNDYKKGVADTSRRGLLFACYQAHIEDGFRQIQATWSNNEGFPSSDIGLDPIIGQVDQIKRGDRFINGEFQTKLTSTATQLTISQFVTMRGGEYFFAPSISALRSGLSGK